MVKKTGGELENQKETLEEQVKVLEMDELYTYIKKDQQNKSMDSGKQK